MQTRKYELEQTDITAPNGQRLYRVIRISDGLRGGLIASEANLSHEGEAFVFDEARVYGNAWIDGNAKVYGNAKVFGNAKVYGNAQCTNLAINIITRPHNITVTDNHIAIGCENHTISHWKKHINEIAKKHNYTKSQLKTTKMYLNAALRSKKEQK